MNSSYSAHESTLRALLEPLGAAIGAILALAVLTAATRQGQFTSIASFGAGAAVAALTSVAVGGGTTLAYTTGSTERQRAVRAIRRAIVLPAILTATAGAMVIYTAFGDLDPLGVLAGGISTSAGVSAELDASFLRRHLKTGQLISVSILNRGIALAAIILGMNFAFAMLAGAVSRALFLSVLTRNDQSRDAGFRINKSIMSLAYEPNLTGLSILYSVCDRVGALVAPATATIPIAGGFVAVLSAQQNASGVLMSGLQTTLAARSQQRSILKWASRLDLVFVLAALAGASLMIAAEERLITILALETSSEPGKYWGALAMLIPASIASRVFDFHFIASGMPRNALASRAVATIVALSAAGVALIGSQIAVLANGLLIAEIASILTSSSLVTFGYLRKRS